MPKLAGSNGSDCQVIPEAMQVEYRYATENIQEHFVILFGGRHSDMAALDTLGDLLDNSWWTGALLWCRQALLPVVLLIPS